mgnify:CR=1 FL=1
MCHLKSHLVVDGFFFQAEDGIRDLVRSRGLGDVYKRQEVDGLDVRALDLPRDLVTGATRGDTASLSTRLLLSLIHI